MQRRLANPAVLKPGDIPPITRMEQLKYLVHGSLTLRHILSQIRDHLLSVTTTDKIIITEDTPLVAWYYERVLNYLHVNTRVLGAYLKPEERKRLIDDFNDRKSELKILIVMYAVSAQGVNLDRCCSRVLVAAPAIRLGNSAVWCSLTTRTALY
jgi:hypothetical protein